MARRLVRSPPFFSSASALAGPRQTNTEARRFWAAFLSCCVIFVAQLRPASLFAFCVLRRRLSHKSLLRPAITVATICVLGRFSPRGLQTPPGPFSLRDVVSFLNLFPTYRSSVHFDKLGRPSRARKVRLDDPARRPAACSKGPVRHVTGGVSGGHRTAAERSDGSGWPARSWGRRWGARGRRAEAGARSHLKVTANADLTGSVLPIRCSRCRCCRCGC